MRDQHEEQRHQQHVDEPDAPVEIELLEARIAEAAHHERAGARGHDEGQRSGPVSPGSRQSLENQTNAATIAAADGLGSPSK